MTRQRDLFAGFSHTYATLPPRFYARVLPTAVREPGLIAFNDSLADELLANLGLAIRLVEMSDAQRCRNAKPSNGGGAE